MLYHVGGKQELSGKEVKYHDEKEGVISRTKSLRNDAVYRWFGFQDSVSSLMGSGGNYMVHLKVSW